MAARLSTGLRNMLVNSAGFNGALGRGCIRIYSGSQPATADSAATGTLLGTVTSSSLALTQETQASQTITVAGTSGSINSVTVGSFNIIPDGAVAFRTDAATTASDLCDAINRNGFYTATVAAAVVTIRPRQGTGAAHNGYVVATTVTTLTATSGGNMAGGVNSANGLLFSAPVAGVISKLATQIWSFNGVAAGTAGWARFYGCPTDDGSSISTTLPRLDGSVAVSGGDFSLSNIVIAVSAPNTCDSFTWTQPAA